MPDPSNIALSIDKAAAALVRKPGGFYFFVQEFWEVIIPEVPVWNWHIEYLCGEAEQIVNRLAKRLPKEEDVIINIPPGTSKSTIFSIMLPAYAWAIDPTLRLLLLSYSSDVAMGFSMKARDIIQSDKYRRYFPDVNIRRDSNSKTDIQNTKQGQIYAVGLGGAITGKHFHYIGIDDPLNPKEAASDADCANASTVIDSTLNTRKVDKLIAVTLLIMQRLSENDPTGHLLTKKGKKIKHICLPAESIDSVRPKYLAEYYDNGLLDPVRLPKAVLEEMLTDLGTANYAGQVSQSPAPTGGLIWQKWFKEVPDDSFPERKHMHSYGTDWDTAYTKNDNNAATAYMTAGKIGNNIYIDDFDFAWKETPDILKWMKTKASPHYIEAKANGNPLRLMLQQSNIVAIEVGVDGGADKVARARLASPIAESGIVYIRKSIADRLYNDPRQGILKFPRNKFKDVADVLAQCLMRLRKSTKIRSHSTADGDEDDF
jgi:phage terminase large subunit-like protein